MIQLQDLPQIWFCEVDAAKVEAEIIANYERITGRELFPGNPERLFLEGVAFGVAMERHNIDYAGKMNLLSHSVGDYMDHIAAMVATQRLMPQPAKCTLRFTLGAPLVFDHVIPQGVRVGAGGEIFFATGSELKIFAGETTGEVSATCQTAGVAGNGYVIGQIKDLIDNVPHVATVRNTTTTLGGADVEDDGNLRTRTQLAPEKFSTCGPEDAYRAHAFSVSQDVKDAAVWSPEEGKIWIAPLMKGGELPSPEIIAAVAAAVGSEKTRPMTDTINVVPPKQITYPVELTYYILNSYAAKVAAIQGQVALAVNSHIDWQKEALGRAVNPSRLQSAVQTIPGIERVEVAQPQHQALDPWQVAMAQDNQVITYGGLQG